MKFIAEFVGMPETPLMKAKPARMECFAIDESSKAPVSAFQIKRIAANLWNVEPEQIMVREVTTKPTVEHPDPIPSHFVRWTGKPGGHMGRNVIRLQHRAWIFQDWETFG